LGSEFQGPFTFDLVNCHRNAVDLSALEIPFSGKEVRDTIAYLPSDKPPGPDGCTGRFYKSYKLWLLNSSYLTLILNKVDALTAKEFRPISLIHSFAKLVTKLLANRLGPRLLELVAANHSAFVRGRSIHDNYMMVQHSIKSLHKRRVSSVFLKLDISKAFDSVSWAFLIEVLSHLGFGPISHNLISNLLVSSSTKCF
jgi:hypothetical protein